MISTSGHLIPKFPEVRFHRTRIFNLFEEWYDQLGGEASPLADAIIDRIAHDSYQINITSIDAEHDRSMREVYGLDKSLRE